MVSRKSSESVAWCANWRVVWEHGSGAGTGEQGENEHTPVPLSQSLTDYLD